MDPIDEFDHLVIFQYVSPDKETTHFCDQDIMSCITTITSLLLDGLTERVTSIKSFFITLASEKRLPALGLKLNSAIANSSIIRGPISGSNEGKAFQEFWCKKSEIRHIDGDLYECVLWNPSINITQQIIDFLLIRYFKIVDKSNLRPWHQVPSSRLNGLLKPFIPPQMRVKIPEKANNLHLIRTLDQLNSLLRDLSTHLPLDIMGVQAISAEFRNTSVFEPMITIPPDEPFKKKRMNPNFASSHNQNTIHPIYVIINIETSGKWPRDDLKAFLHMKNLFLIRVHELLTPKGVPSRVVETGMLDIFINGLILRVSFYQPLEHRLIKIALGMIVPRNKSATALSPAISTTQLTNIDISRTPDDLKKWLFFNEKLPEIASHLCSVSRTHMDTFPDACRLVKRWLSAHGHPVIRYPDHSMEPPGLSVSRKRGLGDADLCTDTRLTEIAVELMVIHAGCFTPPVRTSKVTKNPYFISDDAPSASPLATFLRFLNLLASFNWAEQPLLVDLNETFLENEDCSKANSAIAAFSACKREDLPALVIATPFDVSGKDWTQNSPSSSGLKQLQALAKRSHNLLRAMLIANARFSDLKAVFRPDLSHMDVLILLKPAVFNSRLLEGVDIDVPAWAQKKHVDGDISKKPVNLDLPHPGGRFWPDEYLYDTLSWFLRQLINKFGEDMFQYTWDRHSGRWIGLKFRSVETLSQLAPFHANYMSGFSCHREFSTETHVAGNLGLAADVQGLLKMLRIWGSEFIDSITANCKKLTMPGLSLSTEQSVKIKKKKLIKCKHLRKNFAKRAL